MTDSSKTGPAQVTVKPLVWEKTADTFPGIDTQTYKSGQYGIGNGNGAICLVGFVDFIGKKYPNLASAACAAQMHALSAITTDTRNDALREAAGICIADRSQRIVQMNGKFVDVMEKERYRVAAQVGALMSDAILALIDGDKP